MSVSFLGAQAVESGGVASSRPRAISASGTPNTKGSYGTPHFTATTFPAAWVLVTLLRTQGADVLVDIAVGGAGAEQVVIADIPSSSNVTTSPTAANYLFPLFIPAGSRIASRCQAPSGTLSIDVQVTLFAPMLGGERGLGQVETCGAVTATSLGTSVDPGGTANTKGSWSPLISATTIPYRWACVSINHTNIAAAAMDWGVDIGVGAGGSEVVVVPDLVVGTQTTNDAIPNPAFCFPLAIPAGTRVSARAQCNVNTASERLIEVTLHGAG